MASTANIYGPCNFSFHLHFYIFVCGPCRAVGSLGMIPGRGGPHTFVSPSPDSRRAVLSCQLVAKVCALSIALDQILETVVTFHFSGGKVYSLNKGCHTCMIKHTMHVQSLHCSIYLTWLDMCIYRPRSHFWPIKRKLGKGQLMTR